MEREPGIHKIDLPAISQILKTKVAVFDSAYFLGDLSGFFDFIPQKNDIEQLRDLKSPMRQLYYLAALNISSEMPESPRYKYTLEEWSELTDLLNEIEVGYDQLFYPEVPADIDENWIAKRKVALPSFLSYFNQGPLNYEEQEIEKIERFFIPFSSEIKDELGLTPADLLNFYEFVDRMHIANRNEIFMPKPNEPSWEGFCQEMKEKNILPMFWNKYLPEHERKFFEFMDDAGIISRIPKQSIFDQFGGEKLKIFLDLFSVQRQASDFLFYTQPNPVSLKPLFEIDSERVQIFEVKQLIHAAHSLLDDLCSNLPSISNSYLNNKANQVELKILEIFSQFFPKEMKFFHNYYVDGNEQDILIIFKGLALIVEAKAYKRREPLRDPDRAYPRIKDDFDRCIDYAYLQTYRVKEKFLRKQELIITNAKGEVQQKIRTKNYHHCFSIVVTLERYGQIQCDLSELLEIYEDDDFPWSIPMDDLEVFFLAMEKRKKQPKDLIQFLINRAKLHTRIVCSDELQICGAFLTGRWKQEEIDNDDLFLRTIPDDTEIFDHLYNKGLGFRNEKYLYEKTSGRFLNFSQMLDDMKGKY